MRKVTIAQALNGPNGLNAKCLGCGRTRHITKDDMRAWPVDPKTTRLDEVEARMRCECGHVGAETWLASPHI